MVVVVGGEVLEVGVVGMVVVVEVVVVVVVAQEYRQTALGS